MIILGLSYQMARTTKLSPHNRCVRMCVHVHISVHELRPEEAVRALLVYHCLPYSFDRGSLTETGLWPETPSNPPVYTEGGGGEERMEKIGAHQLQWYTAIPRFFMWMLRYGLRL